MALASALFSIGEFSRVTHLTIKTLRHYDEVSLLRPVRIDTSTGYRYYSSAQLPQAQVIRRLRELDMSVADVKAVMDARDPTARNALIAKHLEHLEQELVRTRAAVESLRAILGRGSGDVAVSHRSVPGTTALAIKAVIDRSDIKAWWQGAVGELRATLRARRSHPLGPICGIYDPGLFQHNRGEALLYAPVDGVERASAVGRVSAITVPGAELAVLAHAGPHDELDITYGHLAHHVSTHELGVEGPIREYYVRDPVEYPDPSDWLTEICWPIFRADPDESGIRRQPDSVAKQ